MRKQRRAKYQARAAFWKRVHVCRTCYLVYLDRKGRTHSCRDDWRYNQSIYGPHLPDEPF